MKAYKIHTFSCYPRSNNYENKNYNYKSIVIPTKFQIPQSLSFISNSKHISRLCKFRCSSSSPSFSRLSDSDLETFESTFAKIFGVDAAVLRKVRDFVISQKILSLSVLVLDEDGKIGQKIDELVGKGIFENDKNKKVNIVLNEVVPLLLENPDRWVSSRLTVSSTGEESFHKLNYDECELPETIAENASCTVRCTKVFMDVAVLSDDIDDKHIKIDSRDDLKVLLHHLMSMQNVQDAYAVSLIGLVSNEKAKAMTDYSHVTF
ncbi:uncharacterized protein LOC141598904 isoform X1 [Silene latifolia]|uniref:uncharacterized protein LOC141598904 isoform X1 n=1 Tax=Silene latifolia TaxID=37657 RepID=UPI003D7764D5